MGRPIPMFDFYTEDHCRVEGLGELDVLADARVKTFDALARAS